MLREAALTKKRWEWNFKPPGWLNSLIPVLLIVIFLSGIIFSLNQGGASKMMVVLIQQKFPLDAVLLEGAAGYSQPQRARLDSVRQQGISLGMFLLTGVNVADARTFFLGYYAPPPQGPAWLGWAYNPRDPEYEGLLPGQEAENSQPLPEEDSSEEDEPKAVQPVSGKVLVGIYHTHNAESYIGDGGKDHQTGENGEIFTVGETLRKELTNQGINTVHSAQIHDATEFMKAYSKSVKTATEMLKDNPSIALLLDLHRDGLPPGTNKSTVKINDQEASRILIVIGKRNPHWQKNEKAAKELIALGEKKYPGLFIPEISYADDARYNQHLANGALLLEFGSQLNTTAEAENAAKACAEILAEWLKG